MVSAQVAVAPANATLVRWSGLCLMAAGVLIAGAVAHPDVFDVGFAVAARESPLWAVWHALWLASVVLSLFGLAGLYVRHADRLTPLGVVGFALAVPGLVLVACVAYVEAFVMPIVARSDPALLDWDGPLLTSAAIRITGGLALVWLLGLLLVGVATWRANIVPRGAAAALTVGAPAFAVFEGLFVPLLGMLSVVVLAAGHVWLGYALWSEPTASAARP